MPIRAPAPPSKLVIHSAQYTAVEGGGKTYDVIEFMQQIISGDSLVFDIESHNFVIGEKNFVPRDPKVGAPKVLRVTYSYDDGPALSIVRQEHSRLVLPEDSEIEKKLKQVTDKYLEAAAFAEGVSLAKNVAESELHGAKHRIAEIEAEKQRPAPAPSLRSRTIALSDELSDFLKEHGPKPITSGDFEKDWPPIKTWRETMGADFRLRFSERVKRLRDEFQVQSGMSELALDNAIAGAEKRVCDEKAIEIIRQYLWKLAYTMNK